MCLALDLLMITSDIENVIPRNCPKFEHCISSDYKKLPSSHNSIAFMSAIENDSAYVSFSKEFTWQLTTTENVHLQQSSLEKCSSL